jgi:hypothetical protein
VFLRQMLRVLGCALPVLLLCGCGSDDGFERIAVSGNVTYRGQPVEKGQIRFIPNQGTEAPLTTAAIVKGKYEAAGNSGVPVGTHRVVITARNNPQGMAESTDRGLRAKQYLPDKYNTKTELTITIPSGRGNITKDFVLTD